ARRPWLTLGSLARLVAATDGHEVCGELAHRAAAELGLPGLHALAVDAPGDGGVDGGRRAAVEPELIGQVRPDLAAGIGGVTRDAVLAEQLGAGRDHLGI